MQDYLEIKTKYCDYQLSNLRELKSFLEEHSPWTKSAHRQFHIQLREGVVETWLKQIGETEVSQFMNKFNTAPFWKYYMAFRLAYTNLKTPKINFDRMVGYKSQISFAKSMLESTKENAQKFKKYGLKSGFGVLLYGPPGCGKTHLVRCLSGSTNRPMLKISLSDFVNEGSVTMEFLSEFDNAILFVDEMESLAEDRDEFVHSRFGSNNTLTLINDEYFETGNMMIGSTNSPWTIDPALLRSGRLDSLIYMGFPNEEDRLELLKHYTKSISCSDVDFEKQAKETKFLSSSDIQNFIRGIVHAKIEGGQEVELADSDLDAHLKIFCPTSIPWLEKASALNFSKYHRMRFPQMIAEIEEYKGNKGKLNYFV